MVFFANVCPGVNMVPSEYVHKWFTTGKSVVQCPAQL